MARPVRRLESSTDEPEAKRHSILTFLGNPRILLWGGLVPLAFLLRLWALHGRRLWMDEFYSIAVARLDLGTFFRMLSHGELNMGLYYVLLKAWLCFGHNELFIRFLSIALAVATIPFLYALGRKLFGVWVGLISPLFLAVNAFHIWYSLEARSYSLLVFLATLSSYCFVEGIRKPSATKWSLYAISTALAAYSHFFGVLLLPAHAVSLLFLRRERVPRAYLIASYAGIGIMELPIGLFVLTSEGGSLAWVPKLGIGHIGGFALALAGRGGFLLLALHAVFCLLALWAVFRKHAPANGEMGSWGIAFVLSWLLVPTGLTLALSFYQPIFVSRFLILCLPAFALLSGFGVSTLNPKWLLVVALTLITGLSIVAIPRHGQGSQVARGASVGWYEASRYLFSRSSREDGIVFEQWAAALPFEYFQDRVEAGRRPTVAFPNPWVNAQMIPGNRTPSDALIRSLPGRYRRVWLVSPREPGTEDANQTVLSGSFRFHSERRFPGISVTLYSDQEDNLP